MEAPEAVASEAVAASSSSTWLYDFFPTARAAFTGKLMLFPEAAKRASETGERASEAPRRAWEPEGAALEAAGTALEAAGKPRGSFQR